ncbi:hypothetical protein Agub_g13047 [Astrephomene gubernaculifera]|uniref:FGFR1 oncogene partner n=1 Tax=Astrephomene gubernaculifera TaxID=47775 RepID=A0AAD3HS21_9CHLO|nr:hypothetical protein Agub_g13047 [Astrephomene gubernaculifera]
MEAIKEAVVQSLEKQGVLGQLKAQLRAQVFIAIEEYETASSGKGLSSKTSVPARNALLSDPDGHLAIQLVLDLLDTCNLAFTKKVFQPELGPNAPESGRQAAASRLGLQPSNLDEPLLLALIKAFKSGSSSPGTSAAPVSYAPASSSVPAAPAAPTSSTTTAASTAATSAAPTTAPPARPTAAPLPRLEPLAPVSKSSLAPLAPLGGGGGSGAAPAAAALSSAAKPPEPTTITTTTTTSAATPAPATTGPAAPAKATAAAADSSLEESGYSNEDFEEEPVEEEDVGPAEDDDDDDYAAALGFKSAPAASSKPGGAASSSNDDAGEAGRGGRLGGGGMMGGGARGRTTLDSDLMAGDRSFGVSNELAGLDAGNSGGLSYSADYSAAGAPSDVRGSLSTSQALLSPLSEGGPKPAKLEPLRPLGGKLSPLAPLAPLSNPLSSSLSSSKEDPLGAKGPKPLGPLGAPVRKSLNDIEKEKEELRRLGILQSGDLSTSIEVETRPRPAGAPPNIYDAEMSISASMDDSGWGGSREERPRLASKALSMDMRETGLSASDRSGDIEHMGVDLAETAEWH